MSEELREKARLQGPWKQETVDGREVWAVKYTTELGNVLELEHSTAEGAREWMSITATRHPSIILALLDERDSLLSANEGMRKALTRLVESELAAKVRSLVAGWNGEGVPEEYRFGRHPDSLGVTLPTDCGSMYMLDEVLADLRAALSPALNSKLAPAGEGEANG